MSDYDDYDGYGDDDYGMEEENNPEDDDMIELENNFLEADEKRESNWNLAIGQYKKVIELQQQLLNKNPNTQLNENYAFKGIEQIIIISIDKKSTSEVGSFIGKLLDMIQKVSKNEANDALNNILTEIMPLQDIQLKENCISLILNHLQKIDEGMYLRSILKLSKYYFTNSRFNEMFTYLELAKKCCRDETGDDIMTKSQYLLEIYSLEIKYLQTEKNVEKMRSIYKKVKNLSYTLNDARIIGTVNELKGKMLMYDGNYNEATISLQEAFLNYQEAGQPQAKQLLKYVTIASILGSSEINPLDNREAQVYKDEKEIIIIQTLRKSYENRDIAQFNKILSDKSNNLMDDEFLSNFIINLKRIVGLDKLIKLVQPYSKIKFDYLAKILQMSLADTKVYMQELILDNKINGSIDDNNNIFINFDYGQTQLDMEKINAINKWAYTIGCY